MKLTIHLSVLLFIPFFFIASSFANTCKQRVTSVYRSDSGAKNVRTGISVAEFFQGVDKQKNSLMLEKANIAYRNFYDSTAPRLEEAYFYKSPLSGEVTGYLIQIGVGADEGSGVFTFDSKGHILFGKTIDQSPEYRYLCNKN